MKIYHHNTIIPCCYLVLQYHDVAIIQYHHTRSNNTYFYNYSPNVPNDIAAIIPAIHPHCSVHLSSMIMMMVMMVMNY